MWPYTPVSSGKFSASLSGRGGADSKGRFTFSFVMVLLTLLLLVLIQWLTVVFPGRPHSMYSSSAVQQTSSSGYDGGGFGLGCAVLHSV